MSASERKAAMRQAAATRYWPHDKPVPPGWKETDAASLAGTHHGFYARMLTRADRQLIVGLCGPEGAGKSTAAAYLKTQFAFSVHPFAGPLKAMLATLGIDRRHIYGDVADKEAPLDIFGGKSARHAMQTLGTEWGRNCIGPDFWVRAWCSTIPDTAGAIVADDVRFANEAAAIKELGGKVIRIDRLSARRVVKHASEDHMRIPADVTIFNDGTVDELRAALDKVILAMAKTRAD